MTEMGRANPQHFPVLDGVRGFAACVVVISHSASLGLLPIFLGDRFGQQAVLLFFTLSGFLMFHLYGRQPFEKAEIVRYGRHRAGRVVPLFYLVVLLSWLSLQMHLPIWAFPVDSAAILWKHLLFLDGVSALWTVPVEIQFYVVFLLLWFFHARQRFLVGLAVVQCIALVLAIAEYRWRLNAGTLPQTMQFFLVGSFIAFLADRHPGMKMLDPYRKYLVPAIVLFTVFSSSIVRQTLKLHMAATWWDPILAGLPILIFLAALRQVKPFHLLASPPLRGIGQISYGIYIFHFPILVTLTNLLAPTGLLPKLGTLLLVWAATVVTALLSYVVFERPLRRVIAVKFHGMNSKAGMVAV